jgi:TonB family protein
MAATRIAAIKLLYLYLLIGSLAAGAHAQEQPLRPLPADTARGFKLYQRGDTEGAIRVLREVVQRREDDADAWYYLGLSYKQEGRQWSARAAFESAVALRPDFANALANLAFTLIIANKSERALQLAERAIEAGDQSAEAHYVIGEASLRQDAHARALDEAELALRIKPDFPLALVTKGMAQNGLKQYDEAAESFAALLAMSPDNAEADAWRVELAHLRKSAASAKENPSPAPDGPNVYTTRQVTAKARVLSKPDPDYTQAARRAGAAGTVVLRGVISTDGKLTDIFVVRWLPYGLTTSAIEAARQVQFTPASIDGKPVSQYILIEYNFNLY